MARGSLLDLLRRPVVVAPMAGGPTTTDLVIAAAGTGALGFLAGAYKTPETMTAEIAAVRGGTAEAFGVNLFVPGTPCPDAAALACYLGSLGADGPLGDAAWDDDGFEGKVAALIGEVAAVTSLPQIAAGGVMGPCQVRAVLAAGAVAAQCGTASSRRCLPTPTPAASPGWRSARASARSRSTGEPGSGQRHPDVTRARRRAGLGGGGPPLRGLGEIRRGTPMKAVRFDGYGGIDVLKVVDVPKPVPGPGQVLVQVKAAGINPGEAKIREGLLRARWPATFPSGEGSDLAGVVAETGPGVTNWSAGDEVIGFTNTRASQAEYVLAEEGTLTARPAGVPFLFKPLIRSAKPPRSFGNSLWPAFSMAAMR